jgi:D-beta-D-heptose 7-phosphate kinase/D-beta-D-heptose 1-phosphate adenosyltransferase
MNLSRLQALLNHASRATITVVGDLMLDRFIYGDVSRISPEAPVPVLRTRSQVEMLGAAGNVVRNLSALGASVRIAAAIGGDDIGAVVAGRLDAEHNVSSFLNVIEGRATTTKTRFMSAGQQLLRADAEDDQPFPHIHAGVDEALAGADVVIISDYAKGFVTAEVLAKAHASGRPIIVDPKGRDFARYGPVSLIKPNASELAAATGLPVESDAQAEAALALALELWPVAAVMVTRGERGASLARRGVPVLHVRARKRAVFDVSGAGDTSVAALALAMAAGEDLEAAVEFAVLASGVAVSKSGTAVITPAELIEAELSEYAAGAEAKVVMLDQAAAVAARWRAEGLRVGFTNGCFDVLHRGHTTYLARARAWCDRLIVALNSDASVRSLKGEGRPVNDLESRAMVLAHLAAVDLVTAFDEDTPLGLIEAIRPDVLIKGADYTRDTVVGADLVEGWGGEVKLAPIVDGHSTTATIAKLRA